MNRSLALRLGLPVRLAMAEITVQGRMPDVTIKAVGDSVLLQVNTSRIRWYGRLFHDPVSAFEHIAIPFLDRQYPFFFDLDEDADEDEAKPTILQEYLDGGGQADDLVFALDHFELPRDLRGAGLGSTALRSLEDALRRAKVAAIILQAGFLDDRSSEGFWRKMGYSIWPGEYGYYDDRIMTKRIG